MPKVAKYLVMILLTCSLWGMPINLYADIYKSPQYYQQSPQGLTTFQVNTIQQNSGYIGQISAYQTIGGGLTANEWYYENIGESPYNYENNSSARRAGRPGGGTGVIPNPTPIGDIPFILLIGLCVCYTYSKKRHINN